MLNDFLLQEQIEYYRARAQEYEETARPTGARQGEAETPMAREWQAAMTRVRALGQFDSILELACGTGLWTRELAQHTAHLTALDAAPEMLEVNEANLQDARIKYVCADLFDWKPAERYDLVFMAFWLSHVPQARLDAFLGQVPRALKPGGRVLILDEPRGTGNEIPTFQNLQARTLKDGRTFTIIKEYYDPGELAERLQRLGLTGIEIARGDYFFQVTGTRDSNHDQTD